MASSARNFIRLLRFRTNFANFIKSYETSYNVSKPSNFYKYLAFIFSGSGFVYLLHKRNTFPRVLAARTNKDELSTLSLKLTSRERRFIKFASVEHDGQLYMTPQDFLESITEAEPRPRLKRRVLKQRDLDTIYNTTPQAKRGSNNMFRTLHEKGIISYTEYLFLLSVLTKPATGFRIAFNMFDTDGNERVDKQEFLVLEKIFSHARRDRLNKQTSRKTEEGAEMIDDELQRRRVVDTTILVHFFGRKGDHELQFDEFKKFMLNLQDEVLEIEFQEFSRGYSTISEVDFAKILLRYTHFQSDQYDLIIDRMVERIPEERGITFDEFKAFCHFLNHLEDFTIAMRMYTMADQPISQEEFHRAVKICTEKSLSNHLVNTVFNIFDEDGDGQLSYKEFIAIMKDRLHRGFKTTSRNEGWNAFKYCLKQEMRASS